MRETAFHRRGGVASRAWRAAERRVVLRGFWGRALIAIEPLAIACFFAALPVLLVVRKQETAKLVGPIFAVASLLFLAYAVVLMVPASKALWETFARIYSVDGYVRYRSHARYEYEPPTYYAAVLDAGGELLGEWPLRGRPGALDKADTWPALVEFTPYGGIHRIDGRSTGVLPDDIPAFGIGAAAKAFAKG
jgi:hypothetical protein